jgi:hypothetical protein
MKSLTFILISLLSGAIAGVILSGVNYFIAEPFIDRAIEIEVDNSVASGELVDSDELNSYRVWQKEGTFAAGAILGLTYGAILGIVYALSRKYLPSSDDRKKALILAAVMCLSLYIIPFFKYPETIGLRNSLYSGYQLASGIIALGVSILIYKLQRISYIKYIIPIFYLGLVASIYAVFPANPDDITAPMDLVNAFRAVTFGTMVMFYLVLGAIFGIMWHKFKPHGTTRITAK